MAFDRVFGQDRVKRLLTASLERGRLAHAYLFYGPPGIGKDAMALSMAMGFHCGEGVIGGCGVCPSCSGMLRLEHPSLHLVLPVPSQPKGMKEAKYHEILRERALERVMNPYHDITYVPEITTLPIIGIDQIRAMKKEVMLKVFGQKGRVFWVSQADGMNAPAANSLLKLLEEPPGGTTLILTTSAPARLLRTIVSRCQTVRFDPLKDEDIERALIEGWSYPEEKARFCARLSGGSLRRALELSGEGYEERRIKAMALLEQGLKGDEASWAEAVEKTVQSMDKAEITNMLRILQVWVRDILLQRVGSTDKVMNIDAMHQLKVYETDWPRFDADRAMKALEQSVDYIEKNVYLNLLLFDLLREFSACSDSDARKAIL